MAPSLVLLVDSVKTDLLHALLRMPDTFARLTRLAALGWAPCRMLRDGLALTFREAA